MGEPNYLSADQIERLLAASRLVQEPQPCAYTDRVIHLELALPPHAVAAVTVEFVPESPETGATS